MNYGASYGGLSGPSSFPSYDYKGRGLLDEDPRGLKKKKSFVGRVAANSVRVLVVVLLLVASGGWYYTHTHKQALHSSLTRATTAATTEREVLRRQLAEQRAQVTQRDKELQQLRARVDRLTAELGNTHNKHTQTSGKLEQDLLNCQGELAVAQNRIVETQKVSEKHITQAHDIQHKLDEETHLRVLQEHQHAHELAAARADLSTCQNQLRAAGIAPHSPAAQQAQPVQVPSPVQAAPIPSPVVQQQQQQQQQQHDAHGTAAQQAGAHIDHDDLHAQVLELQRTVQELHEKQAAAQQAHGVPVAHDAHARDLHAEPHHDEHDVHDAHDAHDPHHLDSHHYDHQDDHAHHADEHHLDAHHPDDHHLDAAHHDDHHIDDHHIDAHHADEHHADHHDPDLHHQQHLDAHHADVQHGQQADAGHAGAAPQRMTIQQRLREARARRHQNRGHKLSQLEEALGHQHVEEAIEQHPERHH